MTALPLAGMLNTVPARGTVIPSLMIFFDPGAPKFGLTRKGH